MGGQRQQLARAAVLYSANSRLTREGRNLAHYVAGCLAVTGSAQTTDLISFKPKQDKAEVVADATKSSTTASEVTMTILHQSKKLIDVKDNHHVKATDDLSAVKGCDLVIICVDSIDAERCALSVAKCLNGDKKPVVMSFSRGPEDGTSVERSLPNNTVIVCCPCFDVVKYSHTYTPKGSASQTASVFTCTSDGNLVVERLSKEKQDAVELVDLLEQAGFSIWSRRPMSAVCWGKLLISTIYATNALSGLPLQTQLQDKYHRKVYAQLIHEGLQVLKQASKSSKWEADGSGVGMLSPRQLELVLHLPSAVFYFVAMIPGTGLKFLVNCAGPMQTDLKAGLFTSVERNAGASGAIGEIVRTAERHNAQCPTCKKVLKLVTSAVQTGNTSIKLSGKALFDKVGQPSASQRAYWSWAGTAGAVLLCLLSIIVGYILI